MKKEPFTKESATSWNQLYMFKIYKDTIYDQTPTLKVLNNTRQQCAIQVVILAMNGSTPVTLTEAQLRSIELIDYIGGTPLPRSDVTGTGHQQWQYTHAKRDYVWDESAIPATGAPPTPVHKPTRPRKVPNVNEQTITFYVSARDASATRHIAARILIPGTNVYVTTKNIGVPDEDGTGDGNGRFNSSVLVRSSAFPALTSSDYGVFDTAGNLMPHLVGNTGGFGWASEHYLHVRYNGSNLALKSVSASPNQISGFGIYKHVDHTVVKWGITYFTQPNVRTVQSFSVAPLNYLDYAGRRYYPIDMLKESGADNVQGASQSRVVVGVLKGNIAVQFRNAQGGVTPDVATTSIYIVDLYGNSHALSLTLGSPPDQIRVTKL